MSIQSVNMSVSRLALIMLLVNVMPVKSEINPNGVSRLRWILIFGIWSTRVSNISGSGCVEKCTCAKEQKKYFMHSRRMSGSLDIFRKNDQTWVW